MRRLGLIGGEVLAALAATTAAVWLLEQALGLQNVGSLYLVAVAVIAIRRGTTAAIVTALGAFLAYNLLFVEPRLTLTVARPEELVTLLLLLFVGLVIGQLAGRQRDRQRLAALREREARALFAISRELATAHRLPPALESVLQRLGVDAGLARAWIGIGPTIQQERVLADTARGTAIGPVATYAVLRRDRGEDSASWARISGGAGSGRSVVRRTVPRYRVELAAGGEPIGSLWCERAADSGEPALEETRLLAATADQVAQAVRRDRLVAAAAEAEIDRRSEELRSALVDSISHDLRTPLATIRAAAGSLADPAIEMDDDARRAAAELIDGEADRLSRLVDSVLDMSRIQSGALVTNLETTPLAELLDPIVERFNGRVAGGITVDLPDDLPALRVDQTFLSQALTNLLDNAATHGSPGEVRIRARASGPMVEITVEDAGAGVEPELLPHLFDRFYRGPAAAARSRPGVGLGLAVVRGLVDAMEGTAVAAPSELGGLAVTIRVPAATQTGDGLA